MASEGRSSLSTIGRGLGLILAMSAVCAFCAVYVAHEQPAYSWDYGSYAKLLVKYADLFAAPGHVWSSAVAWSVAHDDYNPTSIVPLMPIVWLFGHSRAVFIVSMAVLYLVPVVVMTAALARTTRPTSIGASRSVEFAMMACAFLAWPFWIVTLRGWPDVVGLLPLGLATIVILRTGYLANASLRAAVFVGLMVWLTFLLRRTYAFACLSLLALAFVFCVVAIVRGRTDVRQRIVTALVAFAVCGGTASAGLLAFQAPLAVHIVQTSYVDEYAMYQTSLWTSLRFVFGIFGPIFSALAALGFAQAIVVRAWAVVFTTLASGLSFVLFILIQMPGEQHLLPFYFWLFPAFALGARTLFDGASAWRRAGVWIVPMLMLASFLATFVPPASQALARVAALLPSYRAFPLRIDNYPGYQALTARLDAMLKPDTKVIVLASTEDMTSTYFEAMDETLAPHLVPISDVDARDGLDLRPLAADIAVVSDPPALMNPAFQRNVEVPNRMIVAGKDYGAAFAKVAGPYLLGHGQRAFIYRRTRAMSQADEDALVAALKRYYPAWTLQPNRSLF